MKQRPVNLSLLSLRYPIAAIVSILHRLSGAFLFVSLPFVICVWAQSLRSPQLFEKTQQLFASTPVSCVFFVVLSALIYHFVAGVRHLLMDLGWGETKRTGPIFAWITLSVVLLLVVGLGVRLWG